MPIKHKKFSLIASTGDPSLVQPGDWNDDHNITGLLDLSQTTGILGGLIPNTPLAFSATPVFDVSKNASYAMTLTGNVTSSSTTGTPINGQLLSLTLTEDATGGRTFAFPANFIFTSGFTFNTQPLAINELTFKFDGVNWHLVSNAGSGGGNPANPNNSLQKNNNGVFGASNETDDGTIFGVGIDSRFKGPNPWADIRAYGARSVPGSFTGPITTASINSGSAVATLASGASFQNGDGVTIVGAGTTLSLSTPAAPTVVPSISQYGSGMNIAVADGGTGATTYCYQIAARTTDGQLTPGSTETCIANGQANLGPVTPITISSYTRSGQTVTITTASPHTLVVNAMARITGGNDFTIVGNWNVATVPDNTHFTITTAADTAQGAAAASGPLLTGATVTWYNVNHISWSAVTNAYQYYIYGRVTGGTKTLIGISYPQNNLIDFTGFPTFNTWDDYGPTTMGPAPTAPNWVPTTVPAAGKNGNLTTTIVSGGGTNTVTLASTAANTVAGANFQFDNGPAFLAAANTVAGVGFGVIHIPVGNFPIYSSVQLPTNVSISVMQVGQIVMEDTMQFNNLIWSGRAIQNNINASSFDWQAMTKVVGTTAYPMFYSRFGNGNAAFSYVSLFNNSFNGMIYLQDAGSIPTSSFDHVQFHTGLGAAANDFLGLGIVARGITLTGGASNWSFTDCTFAAGLNNNVISDTPLLYWSVSGMPVRMNNVQFAVRGMAFDTGANGAQITIDNLYNQGPVMPMISLFSSKVAKVQHQLESRGVITDSSSVPVVNYFGFPPNGSIFFSNFIGQIGVAGPGGVNVTTRTGTGATGGGIYEIGPLPLTSVDGINSRDNLENGIKKFGALLSVDSNRAIYVNSLATAAPTCSVSAGGSVALNTYQFAVAPVFAHHGEGALSQRSTPCTTTSGNQTVTINWTTVPGAIGYNIYIPNLPQSFQASGQSPFVLNGATTSFVWTNQAVIGESVKAAGGGPTELTKDAVFSNSFVLPGLSGVSTNGAVTIDAPVLTAARSFHLPDVSGYPYVTPAPLSFIPNTDVLSNASGQLVSGVGAMEVFDSAIWPNGSLPATNADWTTPSGVNPINYVSNAFQASGGTYNLAAYTGVTFAPDNQWASVRVANPQNATYGWAAVRMSTSANTWYGCGSNNSNTFNCIKLVAGVGTTLPGAFAYTKAAGDTWAINVTGTTITGYLNGVAVITTTDSAIPAGGSPGIAFFGNSGLTLNNFMASSGAISLGKAQTWTGAQTFGAGITGTGTIGTLTAPLDKVSAAGAANSINNGDNAQTWNWALTTAAKTAINFTENTAAINGAGSQFLHKVGTLAGSTAVPLNVFSSLTGSQTLPTVSITPTWNTSGVVDAALLVNPTNTASGSGSLLIDAQLGNTSQWKVDKAGNVTQLGTISAGSTPPACTAGTGGGTCLNEGTAPSSGANFDTLYASSADHMLHQNLNNGGDIPVPNRVMLTSTYTNATTTASNITGLAFSVAANSNYAMDCHLYYQGSATTAGLDITITGPASPTSVFYSLDEDTTVTTFAEKVTNAFGTKLPGATTTITATTDLYAHVTMGLRNGANSGTVQVQGSANGTGTVTVQAGSFCIIA